MTKMKIGFVYNLQRNATLEEAEFDTPKTIDSLYSALKSHGDEVIGIEMTRDGSWIQKLAAERPDIIFNTAEGFGGIGRESFAPIAFEQLGIPYVGSGPYSCFLTLDKSLTKQVVARRGVPVPEGYFVTDLHELELLTKELNYPVFVKPNFEGSSKGITQKSLCPTKEALLEYAASSLKEFPEGLVVERYIEGKDITVPYIAGLGQRGVLEVIQYMGDDRKEIPIYDYDLKNVFDEKVVAVCPAEVSPEVTRLVKKYTLRAVHALGIVDMGRADFRVTPSGDLYFIEFNALPSLQESAGLFIATNHLGLTYNETIQKILSSAIQRRKLRRRRVDPLRRLPTRDPKVALVYNLKRKTKKDDNYELEAEFDSQSTIDSLCHAIESLGHPVVPIEASRDLATQLTEQTIDVVFNIAEGSTKRGREAQVPAICDLLGIEHTGSDATCLAVTLDKSLTSRIVQADGIRTPRSKLFSNKTKNLKHDLQYPVIVKPNLEGTSKGIFESSVAEDTASLTNAVERLWAMNISSVLLEEYVIGREFTVGVLENQGIQILGPQEVVFKTSNKKFPVYSFEAKQLENQFDNEVFQLVCPADISTEWNSKIRAFAKKCFRTLGCRDVARIDFRVDQTGEIFFIEINPLPGLSPGFSDMTIMAEKSGWTYAQLISSILNPAIRRWRKQETLRRRKTRVIA